VLLGLLGISLLVAYDILIDVKEGLPFEHVFHETVILSFALILTLFQLRVISRQRVHLEGNAKEIDELRASREEFRRRATRFSADFSAAVNEQFTAWGLTESERDIAILLVKGLSMKEIADLRQSKEATVRQQATAVYRKAKLEGRQELASYFLEDLFSSPPAGQG
jgi:DNA-binding CsgD family transcriptional regulator